MHDHSIWTFEYCGGKLPSDFMGGAPIRSNQGLSDITMVYSVIRTAPAAAKQLTILVDTGFLDAVSMTGRKFEGNEQPATVLAKAGFKPSDIDIVVLTHLHFDHAGGFDAFPNARILVQRCEYEGWKEALSTMPDQSQGRGHWELSSIDLDVMARFDAAVAAGRIEFVDGELEISPGIRCHLAPDNHTFGMQWVEIETPDGPYVIASDCVYWYLNIERMWPPSYVQGNSWNLMKTYRRLLDVVGADKIDRIIPGHDPEIFSRHPSWVSGLHPVAEVHLAGGEPTRMHGAHSIVS
ncbi:N-acyl homoserine lactone hydrolase [Nitrobacteraceae bacterium AZCC 2161]